MPEPLRGVFTMSSYTQHVYLYLLFYGVYVYVSVCLCVCLLATLRKSYCSDLP